MTVHCLDESQKDLIVTWYKQKIYNQKMLSKKFSVSERTINRVLEERSLATPVARVKGEAYQAMQILKEHNLTVEQLKYTLSLPALTFDNVQQFLYRCSRDELAKLFYNSGLVKLSEMLQVQKSKQETAHAKTS